MTNGSVPSNWPNVVLDVDAVAAAIEACPKCQDCRGDRSIVVVPGRSEWVLYARHAQSCQSLSAEDRARALSVAAADTPMTTTQIPDDLSGLEPSDGRSAA